MKVFLVTKEGFPHGMAASKRIMCYAKGWISQGIDCEVVVYTRSEVYGKKPKNTKGSGMVDGIVPFRYIKGTPLRESNVLARRWNDYLDRVRLKKYLLANLQKGDMVFAYNGNDSYSKDILKIAHSCGAAYAQELCELPFGTAEVTPALKKKRQKFEKTLMPLLDGMISISDALTDYARQHCSPECIITKVPILVNYEEYVQSDQSEGIEPPYIFHSGTLFQQKDGFLDMLKAFGMAARQLTFDVRFVSTGKVEGSRHEAEIKRIIKEYDITDKVTFTGYLSNEELRRRLAKAAFVVINKLTTKQNKYCFSTKLGEYMAASKAIITTRVGESMNWLTHEKDAYIIEPDNVNELSQAMVRLFQDVELRTKLGQEAEKTCDKSFSIMNNSLILSDFARKMGGVKMARR